MSLAAAAPAAAQDVTFASLDGAWGGSGKVRLENGNSEKLKCKGYYNAKSGSTLGMAINCGNAWHAISDGERIFTRHGRFEPSDTT